MHTIGAVFVGMVREILISHANIETVNSINMYSDGKTALMAYFNGNHFEQMEQNLIQYAQSHPDITL